MKYGLGFGGRYHRTWLPNNTGISVTGLGVLAFHPDDTRVRFGVLAFHLDTKVIVHPGDVFIPDPLVCKTRDLRLNPNFYGLAMD